MELLTPKQVAESLGIHLNTVYRLIANGDLTAVRVGPKLLRVSKKSLGDYVLGYKTKGQE